MYERIRQWCRHNTSTAIGVVLASLLLLWVYGCPPRTQSLLHGQRNVTGPELRRELDNLVATATERFADLETQVRIRDALFSTAADWAQGGSLNPFGILNTIAGILGIGFAVDNRRKDTVIKVLKKNGPPVKSSNAD